MWYRDPGMRLAALVPAYQAAGTVRDVVAGMLAYVDDVLVVDDGSDDGTGAAAGAAGATVLRHSKNRGKGAALVSGFRQLERLGFSHALTLDADGQHLPSEAPRLVEAAAQAPEALIVGVRRKQGQPIRLLNRFGNWVADGLMRWITGRSLPDTQSGFRIYPLERTLALRARGCRFDFETEVLLLGARAGRPLLGVPVTVYYPPIGERVSHYRPCRDTALIVATVTRAWLWPQC